MDRRGFLGTVLAAAVGATLDPEQLLWVPGAKTIFLPSRQILTVPTMAEALRHGFIAEFPDGARMEVSIGGPGEGLTLDERVEQERRAIRAMGGRIVENRQWDTHGVSHWWIR